MEKLKQTEWQLAEVARMLNKYRIKFYITSSYAVYFYTKVNVPGDVDLVVRRQDIPKIEEVFGQRFQVLNFGKSGNATSMKLGSTVEMACFDNIYSKGKRFNLGFKDSVYQKAKSITIQGIKLHIIPIEDLIALKIILNRKSSQGIKKADLDHARELIRSGKVNWVRMIMIGAKYMILLRIIRLKISNI
jgi:predicted nucleotidyltransferase